MGNQKLKWTPDEEKALLAGVEKHGAGKWRNIIQDPQFASSLISRSNVDLKDKWRNLSASGGQGSRDKSREKQIQETAEHSTPDALTPRIANPDAAVDDDLPNSPQDGPNAASYNSMIFEALSIMNDEDGSDLGAIFNFVELRHEPPVPPNLRRVLSSRLRKLVSQGKLEKVQNGYKIKMVTSPGSATNTSATTPQLSQNSQSATPAQIQAAEDAAQKIADCEYKSALAAQAVEMMRKVTLQAEEANAMLELANEIYAKCCEDGEYRVE